MANFVSEYKIRVPEGLYPGDCLEKTDCLKISAAPEAQSPPDQYWCYVDNSWVLYGETTPPPPTQTITFQGVNSSTVANETLNELRLLGCPFAVQAVVICDDSLEEVVTFVGVTLNARTPDNGYGWGIPNVDTGSAPPATVTQEGTWPGVAFTSYILKRGAYVKLNTEEGVVDALIQDVFFCDTKTCGATVCGNSNPSDGCRTAYAILDDGTNPIIAEYHVGYDGEVTLVNAETFSLSNGIVGAVCLRGQLIITDGTCVYTTCGELGLTKVELPAEVTPGSIVDLAATRGATDHIYLLFGTSGVAHSRNGRKWTVVLQDGFFPAVPQQTGIVAMSEVVVTYGIDSSLQFNNNGGGGSWSDHVIDADSPNDDVLGVALGMPNRANRRYMFIYPITTDGSTKLTVYFSGDNANNFEARATFDEYPTIPTSVDIASAVGGTHVYVHWDEKFWVNVNYACECDWVDKSVELACVSSKMAVCPYDPNTILILGDNICDIFAINDVGETEIGVPVIIDLTSNDRPAPGETIDNTTLVLPAPPVGLDSIVDNLDGTVTITPTALFEGVVTFTYDIDDTGGNTGTATVKVIVGDPDASVLVC